MKTEKIAAALRCSSQVPGPQLDCRTCPYHMEETVDGVDYAGCDCDRVAVDAADRLEELVDRCARYAEEIAVLRERVNWAVEDASPYAVGTERQDVGGGVLDAPEDTEKMLGTMAVKYTEIRELHQFCCEKDIACTLEPKYDGFKLSFPDGADFVQHFASYGAYCGCVEPAGVDPNCDHTAVPLARAKELVLAHRKKLEVEKACNG